MSSKQTPSTDLGVLRELVDEQAEDGRVLAKLLTRHREQREELDPKKYAPDFLAQRRRELDDEMETRIRPIAQRMEARAEQARTAVEEWTPSRRRMAAALGDPIAAEALSRRLDAVPLPELTRLAGEAVATGNWLLADALMVQVDRRRPALPTVESANLARQVGGVLDTMDGQRVAEAQGFGARVGRGYVEGALALAEAQGRPIPPADRLTMIRAYPEPQVLEPAGV